MPTWTISGVAGFIGSHLLQALLEQDQQVVGIDNLATGLRENLDDVRAAVGPERWARFRFLEADLTDPDAAREAVAGADVVLHQAALGSVPRSLENPRATHLANVDGTLTLLIAARDAGVRRFVYAGSSSTYGDEPQLPKREDRIGRPLSPYAVSKRVVELYAENFHHCYGLPVVGLRYFNVFGPRQRPDGPYAAVIPKWIDALVAGRPCVLNGDGSTSRDFTFVGNVVAANLLAAQAPDDVATGDVFNIAAGGRTTLLQLFDGIRDALARHLPDRADLRDAAPQFAPERPGDVRHSQADIAKARTRLSYEPAVNVRDGLDRTVAWHVARHAALRPA